MFYYYIKGGKPNNLKEFNLNNAFFFLKPVEGSIGINGTFNLDYAVIFFTLRHK